MATFIKTLSLTVFGYLVGLFLFLTFLPLIQQLQIENRPQEKSFICSDLGVSYLSEPCNFGEFIIENSYSAITDMIQITTRIIFGKNRPFLYALLLLLGFNYAYLSYAKINKNRKYVEYLLYVVSPIVYIILFNAVGKLISML